MEGSFNNDHTDDILNMDYDSIYHSHPQRLHLTEEAQFHDLMISPNDDELTKSEAELSSLDHFTEYLKCFICYRRVKEPVMCPTCSKFACEACLKKWIIEEKSECPFCRGPLCLSQLIKVRFIKDFSKVIDSLKMQQVRNYSLYEKNETIDKCKEHSLKMIYFCVTCDQVICPDCVMFTKNHANHEIERLKNIYEKKIDSINKEMVDLKKKIYEYEKYLTELSKKADQLKEGKERRIKDLLLLSRALNAKLESDVASRLHSLGDERRKVEDELEYFESIYTEMSSRLKHSTPAKTICNSDDYLKQLIEVNHREFQSSIPKNMIAEFEADIGIEYATGVFVLKPYSIKKNCNEIVYSDPLVADGITWRIKAYPNGTGKHKSEYLSLFVEMVKGWENGGAYCYKVILVKLNKETENIEREYISEFENSICWGYNRFCKIEDIENQGFWDKDNDQIVLRYQVKPANHLQKIKDQSNFIKSLEGQIKTKQESIQHVIKEKRNSRIMETVGRKKDRHQIKIDAIERKEGKIEIINTHSKKNSIDDIRSRSLISIEDKADEIVIKSHDSSAILVDKEAELMINDNIEDCDVICEIRSMKMDEARSDNLIDDEVTENAELLNRDNDPETMNNN